MYSRIRYCIKECWQRSQLKFTIWQPNFSHHLPAGSLTKKWILSLNVQFQKISIFPPTEGIGISQGVAGFGRPKNLKKYMKLNWNFQRIGRVLEKNPFRRGKVDIFWNYTIVLFITVLLIWEIETHLITGISWLVEQSCMQLCSPPSLLKRSFSSVA